MKHLPILCNNKVSNFYHIYSKFWNRESKLSKRQVDRSLAKILVKGNDIGHVKIESLMTMTMTMTKYFIQPL